MMVHFSAKTCISFKIRCKQKMCSFRKLWASFDRITISFCILFDVISLNCVIKQLSQELIKTLKQFKSTLHGFKCILSDFLTYESLMRFLVKIMEKVRFLLILFKSLSKSYYYFSLNVRYGRQIHLSSMQLKKYRRRIYLS